MKNVVEKAIKKLKSNGLDAFSVGVSFSSYKCAGDWLEHGEPHGCIDDYSVDIEQLSYNNDGSLNKKPVGDAICYYIRGSDPVNNYLENILIAADCMCGDLFQAVQAVTGDDGTLSDDFWGCDVMYIDRFFIKPEFRGLGIGGLAFPLVMNLIGREAGAITIIPCPTENDGETRIEKDDPRYLIEYNKLCKLIIDLGFYCADKENKVWVYSSE